MRGKTRPHGESTRSSALDIERDLLTGSDPKAIAQSLKQAAERSKRRKARPYNSAMSMLSLYINRAGDDLDPGQRRVLEAAKDELRALYGRPVQG